MDKQKADSENSKAKSRRSVDVFQLLKPRPTKLPKTAKKGSGGAAPLAWRTLWLSAAGLVFLVLICYLNSLWGQPVFNDAATLAFLGDLQDQNLFWSRLWTQAVTNPLTQQWLKATYAWDFQSAGLNSIWFHAVNIGLHATASLYLWLLTFRLSWRLHNEGRFAFDPYFFSFLAAALFACHPLNADGVSYISGRAAPLVGANYFLSLNLFLLGYLTKSPGLRFWGYAGALSFSLIALEVGAAALTIPLAMISLAVALKSPSQSWRNWAIERAYPLAALIISIALLPYLMLTGISIQTGNGAGLMVLPPEAYLATQLKAVATYYLRAFVLPVGLSLDPPLVMAKGMTDPLSILGGIILCLFAGLTWFLRNRPIPAFAAFMVLIGVLPDLLLVQPEYLSDRRLYIAMSGLCLLAASLILHLTKRSLRTSAVVSGLIILLLCGLTVWRNTAYLSDLSLWQSTVAANPDSARAQAMLSLTLRRKHDLEPAKLHAQKAVQLNAEVAPGHLALGGVLVLDKDYAGASIAFRRALELANKQGLSPDIVGNSAVGLAESLLSLGKPKEALTYAQTAMETDARNPHFQLIAGKCYLADMRPELALLHFESAARLNPHMPSVFELMAEAALLAGKPEAAYDAAQVAVLQKQTDSARVLMAQAAVALKRHDEAKMILEKLPQKNAAALALLSHVEQLAKNTDKAAAYRRQALSSDPEIFAKLKLP